MEPIIVSDHLMIRELREEDIAPIVAAEIAQGWHSRGTRVDRHSSRVEAKNPALLSNRDGYLLELTGWTKGSQAS